MTDRQKLFIEHYLATFNATQSAIKAGYSQRTAYSIGQENLKKPEIRKEIDRRLGQAAMSANEVLARLSMQASSNMGDFISIIETDGVGVFAGKKVHLGQLDLAKAAKAGLLGLIRKFKVGKDGTTIELYDAHRALVTLAKYHRLIDRAGEPEDEPDDEPDDELDPDALAVEAELMRAGH